ncbi:MAG: nitrous oxide reductase family maturation protein NosD [Gemmatimonadetes bacterium]|nr:nitrous oxide reductase family maturation protein NosD [Gemmatimonadota bacterium]
MMLAPVVALAWLAADTLRVGAHETYTRIADALRAAAPGAVVVVGPGRWREPTLVIGRPLTLLGRPGAILDGEGQRSLLVVNANDVTVAGLTFEHTGTSQVDERAAIRVRDAERCQVHGNTIVDAQFAIYLETTRACEVRDNVVRGPGERQMSAGNGIHAWKSERTVVTGNRVTGHRDGIYFEFVTGGFVARNVSEQSARYGMHFMFSNDCTYEANTYRDNGNGVAVMYSHHVTMRRNVFARSRGSASYGLLLKDINDSEIVDNQFLANSVGLYLEDAGRNRVVGNTFRENGWALRSLASAQDNRYEGNTFELNAFDVTTNSRQSVSTFRGNYWDRYQGYDLDRNGVGDVPHLPVRLFSLVVEQSPASALLLRSILVDLMDLAERAFPALTASDIRDEAPLLVRPLPSPPPPPSR